MSGRKIEYISRVNAPLTMDMRQSNRNVEKFNVFLLDQLGGEKRKKNIRVRDEMETLLGLLSLCIISKSWQSIRRASVSTKTVTIFNVAEGFVNSHLFEIFARGWRKERKTHGNGKSP